MEKTWDCVVVGGGAAGLSAALVLGRARWRTLVVDGGRQSNRSAHGIGGLLGHDGRSPAELYEMGREELSKYPSVEFRRGTIVDGTAVVDGFSLTLDGGENLSSRRVLLTGGMEYEVETIPGMDDLWGRSVFHCPFCHGWEVQGEPLAVRGNGDRGVHGSLLLRGWSDDVVLLTDGPPELDDEQIETLRRAGVEIDSRPISGLASKDGALVGIEFTEGERLDRRGLLVAPLLRQRSTIPERLGVKVAEANPMFADALEVDAMLRTSVPGIFAAGDLAGQHPQVAAAIASGSMAGAAIVQSLLVDDFGLPGPKPVEVEA